MEIDLRIWDRGRIKVPEILRFPDDDGFFFNHIWGKTLRDGDGNVFGVRRNAQVEICPIQGIERYMEAWYNGGFNMRLLISPNHT